MGMFADRWAFIVTNLPFFYSLEVFRIQVPTPRIYSDVFVVLLLPYVFIDAPSVIPIPLPLGRRLSWPSFYCVSLRVYLVNNSFSFPVSLSVVPPTPIALEVRYVGSTFFPSSR